VRFRKGAKLDPARSRTFAGAACRRRGRPRVGGGGIGIVVLVIYLLVSGLSGGGGLGGQLGRWTASASARDSTPSQVSQECKTGEDANQREDCRIVAVVNSVQKFWDGVFQRSGEQYQYVDTVFFTDQVNTGCGTRPPGRPVLLPADKLVYIDLGFFDELQQFGARTRRSSRPT
jgi:predicted metalloprotease